MTDKIFDELASRRPEDTEDANVHEDFETVKADPMTGKLVTESDSGVMIFLDHSTGDYLKRSERVSVPVRTSSRVGKGVNTLYDEFISNSLLLFVGSIIVLSCKSPSVEPLMNCNVQISHDAYMRRNPTWGQVKKREDKENRIEADKKERKKHLEGCKATFRLVCRGRVEWPYGTYKVRWVVLGNLDEFSGETYAPTTAKKVIWLLYAVSIILGLSRRFFDIKVAFLSEKLERVVYVSIDGDIYELMYSLYGLPEAARLFNTGLVQHLKDGGYVQSKWDQCLFIKKTSSSSYIFVGIHVDDFNTNGSTKAELDELGVYLRKSMKSLRILMESI